MWAKNMLLADHAWKHAAERREKAAKRRAAAIEAEAQDQFRKLAWQEWCKQRMNLEPLPDSSSSGGGGGGGIEAAEQQGEQQQQQQRFQHQQGEGEGEKEEGMAVIAGDEGAAGRVVGAGKSSDSVQQ
jgi:hypothetical protein